MLRISTLVNEICIEGHSFTVLAVKEECEALCLYLRLVPTLYIPVKPSYADFAAVKILYLARIFKAYL